MGGVVFPGAMVVTFPARVVVVERAGTAVSGLR